MPHGGWKGHEQIGEAWPSLSSDTMYGGVDRSNVELFFIPTGRRKCRVLRHDLIGWD